MTDKASDKASQLLISTEKLLVLDINDLARSLQSKYNESFRDPPEGLYTPFQTAPLLKSNTTYMVDGEVLYLEKIDSPTILDDLKIPADSVISDSSFKTIITPDMRKKYAKHFTVSPIVNPYVLQAIQHMVTEHIRCMLAYSINEASMDELYECLSVGGIQRFESGVLEELCDDMFAQISNFMVDNPWNIYFVSLKGYDVFVEMSIDYRIYEWTRYHADWNKPKS
jgi:hypothetical protein